MRCRIWSSRPGQRIGELLAHRSDRVGQQPARMVDGGVQGEPDAGYRELLAPLADDHGRADMADTHTNCTDPCRPRSRLDRRSGRTRPPSGGSGRCRRATRTQGWLVPSPPAAPVTSPARLVPVDVMTDRICHDRSASHMCVAGPPLNSPGEDRGTASSVREQARPRVNAGDPRSARPSYPRGSASCPAGPRRAGPPP